MATRKSKTIRANPLDAISAVSMEKVKAPLKNARPKKTAQSVSDVLPVTAASIVETSPVASEKVKTLRSATRTKSIPAKTKAESLDPEKNQVETFNSEISKPASVKSVKRTPVKRKLAEDVKPVTPDAVPEPPVPESKAPKKCAEDVFEEELVDLKVNAGSHKQAVLPDLPQEAFAAVENVHARSIIKQWAQWSAVGSMVPAPFMGTVLISAAQIKMIHSLCKTYNVPFERNLAVAVATGLVGGSVASGLAQLLGRLVIKMVPYLGTAFTIAVEPALSYASSYAIGMSFVKHFEAGGTLDNFNAREMQNYFSENVTRCLTYLRDRKSSIFASKSVQS